jgi:hypothetical protein
MDIRERRMNNLGKKVRYATLIAAAIFAMLFLAGCRDSEMAKGLTDIVKKSVGSEVAKKGDEFKKQFDQIVNPGSGKGQKEDGKVAGMADKEKSEKGSGRESSEEKD